MKQAVTFAIGMLMVQASAAGRSQDGVMLSVADRASGTTFPVRLYAPGRHRPLAIILPGVGLAPEDYGFVSRDLMRRGYAVAALQLLLPSDPPMPNGGDLALPDGGPG